MRRIIDQILLEYAIAVLVAIALEDWDEISYLHSLIPQMRFLKFIRDLH